MFRWTCGIGQTLLCHVTQRWCHSDTRWTEISHCGPFRITRCFYFFFHVSTTYYDNYKDNHKKDRKSNCDINRLWFWKTIQTGLICLCWSISYQTEKLPGGVTIQNIRKSNVFFTQIENHKHPTHQLMIISKQIFHKLNVWCISEMELIKNSISQIKLCGSCWISFLSSTWKSIH